MIYVVCGPTGVGKTKLSVMLAKKYNGIVVNADSMQVYKYLDIGTAKVTESEKEGIPHLLFDIVNPDELYTVFDYQRDLRKVIEENKDKIFEKKSNINKAVFKKINSADNDNIKTV